MVVVRNPYGKFQLQEVTMDIANYRSDEFAAGSKAAGSAKLGLQALAVLISILANDVRIQADAPEQAKARPYFVNVAKQMGLEDKRAGDCCFVDANSDGYWDVFLNKRWMYLNQKGAGFKLHPTGIDYPLTKIVPLKKDGKPDPKNARQTEFVPQYVYFADLDNDGDMDAVWGVHSSWEVLEGRQWKTVPECDHGLRTRVYLNDARGKFRLATESGLTARDSWGPAFALAIVDYDNDGCLDLYEGRDFRRFGYLYGCGVDMLFKGDGQGGFKNVTKQAGMLTVPDHGRNNSSRPSYGVTHGDMNNDGHQDLLQLCYGRQWNYQWSNDGDGTFTEVGKQTGFAGDGITHGKYPSWVRRRPRPPFMSNGNTFSCAIGDYDNDGDLDCYLGEIQHSWAGESSDPPSLLINLGEKKQWKFRRVPVTKFLPKRPFRRLPNFRPDYYNYADLHTAWLDYDNDGLLDLLVASGAYPDGQFLRLYRQKPDHSFDEVTRAAGFGWESCGGLSVGDFDRDGDVDILVGRSFTGIDQAHRDKYMNGLKVNRVGLFLNQLANANGNHWLNVRLRGKGKGGANRGGIGARVWVKTGKVTQLREVRCGSGLQNHQDPPEACFGLGKSRKVDRLVIRWPNARHTEQVFNNVPADRFVIVTEGKDRLATGND